jgi:hypothetical protein
MGHTISISISMGIDCAISDVRRNAGIGRSEVLRFARRIVFASCMITRPLEMPGK